MAGDAENSEGRMIRCPHCRRSLNRKPKARRYTVSVSAPVFAAIKAFAEAKRMSMRQVVEEATR